jgi:hypothetical protein
LAHLILKQSGKTSSHKVMGLLNLILTFDMHLRISGETHAIHRALSYQENFSFPEQYEWEALLM